jgi:DNA processing protein
MAPDVERRGPERPEDILSPDESRVLDAIPLRTPAPVERVAVTAGMTPREVIGMLGVLESVGLARHINGGWVRTAARRT